MLGASMRSGAKVRNPPKQLRARLKREALISAASAEFAECGYEQSTAKSIAARAGVASGSFYQHFDNKDEILRVVAEVRFGNIAEQLVVPSLPANGVGLKDLDVEALFYQALAYVHDFHANDTALHDVLEQRRRVDPALNALISEREAMLLQKVRRFVALFEIRQGDAVAFALHAMAEGLIHRHAFQPSPISREELLRAGSKMLAAYFERLRQGD
mgnify:CR=1 FL=1